MTRNYGIRYPSGNNEKEDNYNAWIPLVEIDEFIRFDTCSGLKGNHSHEFIPKDYVVKK